MVVEAIKQNDRDYDDMTFSVTEILNPVRMIWLNKRYKNEIETDVSSRIWSLLGTSTHHIVEEYETDTSITEERLYHNIEGLTLTGQIDIYEDKTLWDLKVTSMWSKMYGYPIQWEQQLNIYRYLMVKSGFEVDKLKSLVIFRDWTKYQGMKKGINSQVDVDLKRVWDLEETEEFIRKQLIEIKAMRDLRDEDLPLCSPEDRWADDTKYAVMKLNRKSAVKLHDNMQDAQVDAGKRGSGHYVEIRKGKDKRCIDYCDCNKFCDYYQRNYGK